MSLFSHNSKRKNGNRPKRLRQYQEILPTQSLQQIFLPHTLTHLSSWLRVNLPLLHITPSLHPPQPQQTLRPLQQLLRPLALAMPTYHQTRRPSLVKLNRQERLWKKLKSMKSLQTYTALHSLTSRTIRRCFCTMLSRTSRTSKGILVFKRKSQTPFEKRPKHLHQKHLRKGELFRFFNLLFR